MPQVHTLKGLTIREISLVDAPANEGAVVTLYKRNDQSQEPDMPTLSEALVQKDAALVNVAKIMADGSGAAFADVSAADFGDAIRRGGATIQKADETPEAARVRFMASPDGRTLLKASRVASGPDHRVTASEAPVTKRGAGAAKEITDHAHALLLNEAGSRTATTPLVRAGALAAAKIRVRRLHPDLAARERTEERAGV